MKLPLASFSLLNVKDARFVYSPLSFIADTIEKHQLKTFLCSPLLVFQEVIVQCNDALVLSAFTSFIIRYEQAF